MCASARLASGLIDIQAGRIPPVFGAFTRRAYPQDNPLIGSPQTYQYLTSVRADAVPATADDLLKMRGRGWLVRYPVGDPTPHNGVATVAAEQWDTGVQVRLGGEGVSGALACDRGFAVAPRVRNDNRGGQTRRPCGLASGAGLHRWVFQRPGRVRRRQRARSQADAPAGHDDQRALGIDAERLLGALGRPRRVRRQRLAPSAA